MSKSIAFNRLIINNTVLSLLIYKWICSKRELYAKKGLSLSRMHRLIDLALLSNVLRKRINSTSSGEIFNTSRLYDSREFDKIIEDLQSPIFSVLGKEELDKFCVLIKDLFKNDESCLDIIPFMYNMEWRPLPYFNTVFNTLSRVINSCFNLEDKIESIAPGYKTASGEEVVSSNIFLEKAISYVVNHVNLQTNNCFEKLTKMMSSISSLKNNPCNYYYIVSLPEVLTTLTFIRYFRKIIKNLAEERRETLEAGIDVDDQELFSKMTERERLDILHAKTMFSYLMINHYTGDNILFVKKYSKHISSLINKLYKNNSLIKGFRDAINEIEIKLHNRMPEFKECSYSNLPEPANIQEYINNMYGHLKIPCNELSREFVEEFIKILFEFGYCSSQHSSIGRLRVAELLKKKIEFYEIVFETYSRHRGYIPIGPIDKFFKIRYNKNDISIDYILVNPSNDQYFMVELKGKSYEESVREDFISFLQKFLSFISLGSSGYLADPSYFRPFFVISVDADARKLYEDVKNNKEEIIAKIRNYKLTKEKESIMENIGNIIIYISSFQLRKIYRIKLKN